MNRIKTTNKIWRFIIILAILLPSFTPLSTADVQAGGLPFLGIIPAMIKRNKVYKEANSFIQDRAVYYDTLRDTAAQQLLDREIGGLRDSQASAYIKLVALIEEERDSMYDFAEGEKKEAREKFINVVQDEITNVMLSTTPATRVLGAMTRGINSSQGFIEGILTEVSGGAGGFFEDLAKIRKWGDRLSTAGGVIGGKVGEDIRKAGAKISDLASPTDSLEADLIKVQEELGALGGLVSGLQDQGYRPTVTETTGEVVIHLVTGESTNPAIEAIADMWVAKNNGQGSIRDRARDIMLGNAAARCRAHVEQIRQVIFKMEIDPVGETEDPPGMFPVCETIDMTALVEEVAAAETSPESQETETTDPATTEGEGVQPTQAEGFQPPAEATPVETDPGKSEEETFTTEYIWVLTSTVANPTNERTSFTGGTGDPAYFGEARFAGKSLNFTSSDGFFSVHAVDVDHGYTYSDTTVSVNFDSPPARLEPAQEITLSASASHGGSVNEGGNGLGLAFQYSYLDRAFDPIFSYHPYNPAWEGSSSQDWVFRVPIVTVPEEEFELWAGLWNSPPSSVVWTYQAEKNPNYSEGETSSQEDSSSGPATGTEADPVCEAKRQEVASKVDIARGADTADLALGIIGHLTAALGDIQVNYCEGGSGAAAKGTPIRIGDCVETGANGRGKITFNDQDDKFNADPTTLFISRGSKMCFNDFTVHRDDGRPGMIDHIKGYIRIITRGWRPGNSLGVDVSIRAAVTVASDIVLEYDPDLDLLRTYVNEGTVSVTDIQTGESQELKDNQLLITQGSSIGEVERMSNQVWNDLLEDQELEEVADDALFSGDSSGPPQVVLIVISLVVIGGGIAAGVFFVRKGRRPS